MKQILTATVIDNEYLKDRMQIMGFIQSHLNTQCSYILSFFCTSCQLMKE